jgi:hypothetical protein
MKQGPSSQLLTELLIILFFFSCHGCHGCRVGEGYVTVTREQVAGLYEDDSEKLELKPDGTFILDPLFGSSSLGQWRIENRFLDGSAILLEKDIVANKLLVGDKLIEKEEPREYIYLYPRRRHGKIALERSESSDWYYERIK